MGLLYGFIGFCVVAVMAILPLIPFWKVWTRLKNNNRDLWNGMGPFDLFSLISDDTTQAAFLRIIDKASEQKDLIERDPELIKWTRVCKAFISILPRSFGKQVFFVFIFLFIISSFTDTIIRIII